MVNPIAGCISNSFSVKTRWVRALRVLLYLWSQKIFKEIGDHREWIATEEETNLKNHLKWARIEVAGDGQNCPIEVAIERDGIKFLIPIWVERQTQYELGSSVSLKRAGANEGSREGEGQKLPKDGCTISTYMTEIGQGNIIVA